MQTGMLLNQTIVKYLTIRIYSNNYWFLKFQNNSSKFGTSNWYILLISWKDALWIFRSSNKLYWLEILKGLYRSRLLIQRLSEISDLYSGLQWPEVASLKSLLDRCFIAFSGECLKTLFGKETSGGRLIQCLKIVWECLTSKCEALSVCIDKVIRVRDLNPFLSY